MHKTPSTVRASTDITLLLWWFATLLGASCIFKLNYLKSVYDIRVVLHYLFDDSSAFGQFVYFLSFFISDIVEVFLVIMLIYVIGRKLLRLNLKALIVITTPVLLFFAMANLLSFNQLRTSLTFETLWISVGWALSDPEAIESFIIADIKSALSTSRIFAPLVAVFAWFTLPYIFSKISTYHRRGDQERRHIWLTLAFVALVLAGAGAMSMLDRPLSVAAWGTVVVFLVIVVLVSYQLRHKVPWSAILSGLEAHALKAVMLPILLCGLFYIFGGLGGFERAPLLQDGHWSTIARSLFSSTSRNYEDMVVPPIDELRERYHALAYPRAGGSVGDDLLVLPADQTKPRHIVIFSLETAFQRHYRLHDNPELPSFSEISKQAIVSENHQTVAPFTISAAFSMLSGLYPRSNVNASFAPDSLPLILAEHEYESTYIDAFRADWLPGAEKNRRLFETMGFDRILDESTVPDLADEKAFASHYHLELRREEVAFERALTAVRDAETRDQPALVFVQSVIGHFPWRAPPSDESDSAEAKIDGVAGELDRVLGLFLDGLKRDGLTDDVIVVITGDHGLRHVNEFESLGFDFAHSDLAFNVPLIISAPGLLQEQVQIPYVTSHIDLAPTLLAMIGVPANGLFHHGDNVLDRKVSQRVTFLLNTNLSPVDGFHWNENFITFDRTSGTARLALEKTRSDARRLADAIEEGAAVPASFARPQALIDSANEITDLTIAYFMRDTSQDP